MDFDPIDRLASMTEAEWLDSNVPRAMLRFLSAGEKTPETARKFRLFACTCVRRVWHLLQDERSRHAVEVAERYADGLATPEELDIANRGARNASWDVYVSVGLRAADEDAIDQGREPDQPPAGTSVAEQPAMRAWRATDAVESATRRNFGPRDAPRWFKEGALSAAMGSSRSAFDALADPVVLRDREWAIEAAFLTLNAPLTTIDPVAGELEIQDREATVRAAAEAHRCYEEPWQANLLRCLFGNPFRPVPLDPTWITAHVLAIARSTYDHQSFDRLPELADALEQAGCRESAIFDHCGRPGEHARGCWVVDLVLGKS